MSKRPSFRQYEEKALKDPAFKAEYDALSLEFQLIRQRIEARQKAAKAHLENAPFSGSRNQ